MRIIILILRKLNPLFSASDPKSNAAACLVESWFLDLVKHASKSSGMQQPSFAKHTS